MRMISTISDNTAVDVEGAGDMADDRSRISTWFLAEWRAHVGWTQQELADRAGVSRNTVRQAERGLPITAQTLGKLARALNISVHTLRTTPPDTTPSSDGNDTP